MYMAGDWIPVVKIETPMEANIHKNRDVFGVVYFGYPAEQPKVRTKNIAEAVYWQKYDPERKHQPRPGNLLVV